MANEKLFLFRNRKSLNPFQTWNHFPIIETGLSVNEEGANCCCDYPQKPLKRGLSSTTYILRRALPIFQIFLDFCAIQKKKKLVRRKKVPNVYREKVTSCFRSARVG